MSSRADIEPGARGDLAGMSEMDRTALSYWFPKIEAAGLAVPKTKLVPMLDTAALSIYRGLNGEQGDGSERAFFNDLTIAANAIGYPCFLRTDHTSAKHDWMHTCWIRCATDIPRHAVAIVEFSEMADMLGLPYKMWAVREFLATEPYDECSNFGNMPVCREFRFFVDDGRIRCWHPYWPEGALVQGGIAPNHAAALCNILSVRNNDDGLDRLAERAGAALGGSWSIDILETKRGWYITDMAEAERSFHWEGCPHS